MRLSDRIHYAMLEYAGARTARSFALRSPYRFYRLGIAVSNGIIKPSKLFSREPIYQGFRRVWGEHGIDVPDYDPNNDEITEYK